jgi:hypothetical protein
MHQPAVALGLNSSHASAKPVPAAAGRGVTEDIFKVFCSFISIPFGPWLVNERGMFYRMRLNADSKHRMHGLVINLYFNNTLLFQGNRETATVGTDLFRAFQ